MKDTYRYYRIIIVRHATYGVQVPSAGLTHPTRAPYVTGRTLYHHMGWCGVGEVLFVSIQPAWVGHT